MVLLASYLVDADNITDCTQSTEWMMQSSVKPPSSSSVCAVNSCVWLRSTEMCAIKLSAATVGTTVSTPSHAWHWRSDGRQQCSQGLWCDVFFTVLHRFI